jgi:hypothetical protein
MAAKAVVNVARCKSKNFKFGMTKWMETLPSAVSYDSIKT